MTRQEFMTQLARLLGGISESERQEALEYYNNYFDDAGPENEAAVIHELGSPGKLAAIIKADINGNGQEEFGEYTEYGYRDSREDQYQQMPQKVHVRPRAERGYQAPKRDNNKILKAILIGAALLVFAPAILGLGGGLLAAGFGVLVAILAGIFSLAIGVICMLVGGIAAVVVGIVKCFTFPGLGILEIGVGLLAVAGSILLAGATAWICIRFLPWLVKKAVKLGKKIMNMLKGKRKGGARV